MLHHAMTREQALKALELHADASFQEIKQAYRDLTLVWHPDRFAHSTRLQEKASERLKQINIAYDVLRSYADGPSGAHEPRTKHTGSKHGTSGTEQSETQRQRSRTKDRGTRPSFEHTESQNPRNRGDHSSQTLRRAWVALAALLFVAVIAGLLNDHPTGVPQTTAKLRSGSAWRPSRGTLTPNTYSDSCTKSARACYRTTNPQHDPPMSEHLLLIRSQIPLPIWRRTPPTQLCLYENRRPVQGEARPAPTSREDRTETTYCESKGHHCQ